MSKPPTIECIVMSAITSETKAGKIRKVTFMLTNDEPEHPFSGLIGQRLHIVALNVGDDETTTPVALAGQGEGGNAAPVAATRPGPSSPASKERRRWDDLPPAQQCAIRCGEPEFQAFIADISLGFDDTAEAVRYACGIKSRAELNTSEDAAAEWRKIENDYWAWQRDPRRSAA